MGERAVFARLWEHVDIDNATQLTVARCWLVLLTVASALLARFSDWQCATLSRLITHFVKEKKESCDAWSPKALMCAVDCNDFA